MRTLPGREKSLPASLTLGVAILAEKESTPGKESHRQTEVANGRMELTVEVLSTSTDGIPAFGVGAVLPMIQYRVRAVICKISVSRGTPA